MKTERMEDTFADGEEWEALTAHVHSSLLPKMDDSALNITIYTGSDDVKLMLEIGAAVLLNKPFLAVVPPGTRVPPKMRLVADEIIEIDLADPDAPELIEEAIDRVLAIEHEEWRLNDETGGP